MTPIHLRTPCECFMFDGEVVSLGCPMHGSTLGPRTIYAPPQRTKADTDAERQEDYEQEQRERAEDDE